MSDAPISVVDDSAEGPLRPRSTGSISPASTGGLGGRPPFLPAIPLTESEQGALGRAVEGIAPAVRQEIPSGAIIEHVLLGGYVPPGAEPPPALRPQHDPSGLEVGPRPARLTAAPPYPFPDATLEARAEAWGDPSPSSLPISQGRSVLQERGASANRLRVALDHRGRLREALAGLLGAALAPDGRPRQEIYSAARKVWEETAELPE